MVGNCTRLPLGTTTPPTLANDERSGTLAVGANLYETDLSKAVPFFAARTAKPAAPRAAPQVGDRHRDARARGTDDARSNFSKLLMGR